MKDLITILLLVITIIVMVVNNLLTSSKRLILNDVKETRAFTSFIQYHQDWDILVIKQNKKIFTIEYLDKTAKEIKIRSFRLNGVHLFPIDGEI